MTAGIKCARRLAPWATFLERFSQTKLSIRALLTVHSSQIRLAAEILNGRLPEKATRERECQREREGESATRKHAARWTFYVSSFYDRIAATCSPNKIHIHLITFAFLEFIELLSVCGFGFQIRLIKSARLLAERVAMCSRISAWCSLRTVSRVLREPSNVSMLSNWKFR